MDEVQDRRSGGWRGLLVPLLLAASMAAYWIATSPSTATGHPRVNGSGTSQVSASQGASSANGKGQGVTDACVEPSNGNGNCAKTFGVRVGTVPAIHPGQTKTLAVTWTNPNSFGILVESYTVSVRTPQGSPTACPASSLQVPQGKVPLSPKVSVPRNGTAPSSVLVGLSANAPEACKLVPFTVTVNATAVKQ